jgi:hypothetical protein
VAKLVVAIIVILFILWLIGQASHRVVNVFDLLLIVAVILVLYNIIAGRRS